MGAASIVPSEVRGAGIVAAETAAGPSGVLAMMAAYARCADMSQPEQQAEVVGYRRSAAHGALT